MLPRFFNAEKLDQIKDTTKTSIRVVKMIWGIDKWLFIGMVFFFTVPAVLPFVNLYIYKLVIDLVVAIASGIQEFDPAEFYLLIGLRIFTYFLQGSVFMAQDYIRKLLWAKIPMHFGQKFLEKVGSLDVHYFEDSKFRDLMDKATGGFDYRPQNLLHNLLYSFQSFVEMMIALVALAQLNWFFIIPITLVAIPEFINNTIQSKMSWGIWNYRSPYRRRYDYLSRILLGVREIKEIRIFKIARNLLNEMSDLQAQFYSDQKKIANRTIIFGFGFNFVSTAIFIGIELYVIFQALTRRMSVGDIGFYTGVVNNFQSGLGGFLRSMSQVFEDSLYVKSVFEVYDAEPIIKEIENPVKFKIDKAPKIEFKNVDFAYPETKNKILNDFSLVIEPGTKVAFVGENGAGKSTIIKLLARFYDVDKGEILIDGIDIKNLDLANWYKHLGVLFQDFNRYEHTVKENVYFGDIDRKLDLEEIVRASTQAGAHPFVNKFDNKYDQILGKIFENGIEPSGGQWQKIALARAFFRSAPILVLDEPTASIDAKAESEIFSRVERLSKDKTVIIISHRFSTVRNADIIYVIDGGKIVESGSHKELMKVDGQYAELFNLQARGYQ